MAYKTREEWLEAACEELRPLFRNIHSPMPGQVRVACGWPSTRALSSKQKRVGECWSPDASEDKVPQIFISPAVSDGMEVLGILVHELIHAKGIMNHGKEFRSVAVMIGLEGKMTATTVGKSLENKLSAIDSRLGPYPHAAITSQRNKKKQTTRMVKVWCPDCGYTVRTTRKWLEIGTPTCTPCDVVMESELDYDDSWQPL